MFFVRFVSLKFWSLWKDVEVVEGWLGCVWVFWSL